MMIKAIVVRPPCAHKNEINRLARSISPAVEVVATVFSVDEGIELVRKIRPSLVFLDVDMPEGSAFRVFEETLDLQYEKIIISNYAGHAIKAARYQVADYLLKPLQEQDLCVAVDRLRFSKGDTLIQKMYREVFRKRQDLQLSHIYLKTLDQQRRMVCTRSIIRIEDTGGLRIIETTSRGSISVKKSLPKLASALVFNGFFRAGNHLFNLHHIQAIFNDNNDNMMVIMGDGYQIPIPISKEQSLRKQIRSTGSEL